MSTHCGSKYVALLWKLKMFVFPVIKLYQTVCINWKYLLYTQQYVTHEDKIH